MKGRNLQVVTTALIVTAFFALNSSLNLLNRYSLGVYGFRFPFFLTATHAGFCFIALLPYHISHGWASQQTLLRRQWKGLAAIGACLAAGISLNNISLVYITLSLNQVIRSSIPVVACLLSVIVEGKLPTRLEAASLVVLSAGVMTAVWEGTVSGRPLGILFCMLGTLSSGAMLTFSGKLLSEKLNVLSLTFYTAPVSLLCLSPFFLTLEANKLSTSYSADPRAVALIVGASSLNALAYNICQYAMVQRLSAVGTTVVGEVKILGLLVLSALILGEGRHFTPKLATGCVLALSGFCMYSHCKLRFHRRQQAATLQYVSGEGQEAVSARQPQKQEQQRRGQWTLGAYWNSRRAQSLQMVPAKAGGLQAAGAENSRVAAGAPSKRAVAVIPVCYKQARKNLMVVLERDSVGRSVETAR